MTVLDSNWLVLTSVNVIPPAESFSTKAATSCGSPVTVTHSEMKRFFMTIPEAVQLVLQAGAIGKSGDLLILDMGEPIKIVDLAKDMIALSGLRYPDDIDIVFQGMRPGERLNEELFYSSEQNNKTHKDLGRTDFSSSNLTDANFKDAFIPGASFRTATLKNAILQVNNAQDADFSFADLTSANLERINCGLRGASFESAKLDQSCLVDARLGASDLTNASVIGADLSSANLHRTKIKGADFSQARFRFAELWSLDLNEATFVGADFEGAAFFMCELEFIELPNAKFRRAVITNSYLTGSIMPRACFVDARIRGCGLADIQWENADLRRANFKNCTFHMGSSRSGLVNSTLASEGTRTGFYTDDYDEQHFKSPEEIRKANLCGADLRGAKVDGVDFYLVDLRGARYSEEQRLHFDRCGAILHDPR